jgi:hypothetical protein
MTVGGGKSLTFKIPPLTKPTFVQIDYVNPANTPLTAQLKVDGQVPTLVLFPPTGGADEVGAVTVEVESNPTVSQSELTFSYEGAPGGESRVYDTNHDTRQAAVETFPLHVTEILVSATGLE